MLSIIIFFLKRTPRVIALVLNFLSALFTFLLVTGCHKVSHRSTYLTKYYFNKSSPFFHSIKKSFEMNKINSGLEDVRILAGYLGVCVSNLPSTFSKEPVVCFGRKSLTNNTLHHALNVKIINNPINSTIAQSIDLNMLDLARVEVSELIHPYLLAASAVLTTLIFFTVLYVIIPKLPAKRTLNIVQLGLSSLLTLLFSLGTIWTHATNNAAMRFIPQASMGLIKTHKGRRASAMTWFTFIFIASNCAILWFLHFRDMKDVKEEPEQPIYNKYSFNERVKYHTDGSTLGSKY